VERWFSFAQARHPQNIDYRSLLANLPQGSNCRQAGLHRNAASPRNCIACHRFLTCWKSVARPRREVCGFAAEEFVMDGLLPCPGFISTLKKTEIPPGLEG
jgi:hypothetical protein